jgi:hypothetical protein
MILVCNWKDGAATGGLRTTGDGLTRTTMMVTMMMMIFYRGIGTKSTATQNSNAKRRNDTDEDDDGNNSNTKTNEDNKGKHQMMKMRPKDYGHDHGKRRNRYDAALVAAPTGSEKTRMMMNEGCATQIETSDDGHGDDLHQGRMEDDEDGGTPMMSATGTLDRKTDQAPPTTCFQPSTPTHENKRPTTNDKECRGHDEDAKEGGRMMVMTSIAARRGRYWTMTDKWTPWYCNQGEAQITFSTLGPSGWRGSVSTRGCDL